MGEAGGLFDCGEGGDGCYLVTHFTGVVMLSGEDSSCYQAWMSEVITVKMLPFIQYWIWARQLVLTGNNVWAEKCICCL